MQNKKKLLISAALMMLLCTFFISNVHAADDTATSDTSTPPSVTDQPILISTADNSTADNSTETYTPTLVQQNDNGTVTDAPGANDLTAGNRSLVSAKTAAPDYTPFLAATVALVAVIAVALSVLLFKKRKK